MTCYGILGKLLHQFCNSNLNTLPITFELRITDSWCGNQHIQHVPLPLLPYSKVQNYLWCLLFFSHLCGDWSLDSSFTVFSITSAEVISRKTQSKSEEKLFNLSLSAPCMATTTFATSYLLLPSSETVVSCEFGGLRFPCRLIIIFLVNFRSFSASGFF